jgi:hypothetical protein
VVTQMCMAAVNRGVGGPADAQAGPRYFHNFTLNKGGRLKLTAENVDNAAVEIQPWHTS